MKTLTLRELRKLEKLSRAEPGYRTLAPRLATLCASVNLIFPDLIARLEPWSYHPYRKIGRLISYTGKRRTGNRIAIYTKDNRAGSPIYKHFPLENSFRTNWDVVEWIIERANAAKAKKA